MTVKQNENSLNNLIKSAELTPKERSERAAIAGRASVEARKRKKQLKECLEILLNSSVGKNENGEDVSGAEAMATTVFKRALNGDLKAWELVRDTAGQKPVEKVVTADIDSEVIEKVEAMVSEYDAEEGD